MSTGRSPKVLVQSRDERFVSREADTSSIPQPKPAVCDALTFYNCHSPSLRRERRTSRTQVTHPETASAALSPVHCKYVRIAIRVRADVPSKHRLLPALTHGKLPTRLKLICWYGGADDPNCWYRELCE